MDLNEAESSVRKAFLDKSLQENKATRDKLFHFLLIVVGVMLGWILCYCFPISQNHQVDLSELLPK